MGAYLYLNAACLGNWFLMNRLIQASVKGHLSRKLVPMGVCHSIFNCIMQYTKWKSRIICC